MFRGPGIKRDIWIYPQLKRGEQRRNEVGITLHNMGRFQFTNPQKMKPGKYCACFSAVLQGMFAEGIYINTGSYIKMFPCSKKWGSTAGGQDVLGNCRWFIASPS